VIFSLIGYYAFMFIDKSIFEWAVGNTDLLFLEHYCGQLLNNAFLPDQSNMNYSFKLSPESKNNVVLLCGKI